MICLYSQLAGNIWRALLRSLPERKHMEEDWRGGGKGSFRLDAAICGRGGVLTREKTTSCCNVDGAISSKREGEITAAVKLL